MQQPHPLIYQVCGATDGIESTAARGWPMLNSILFGPLDQLLASRDSYVADAAAARALGSGDRRPPRDWGVSRQIYVAEAMRRRWPRPRTPRCGTRIRFAASMPERIEDAHPTLQPGFRATAERLRKVTWEGLVAETVAFGSPDTVAATSRTCATWASGRCCAG